MLGSAGRPTSKNVLSLEGRLRCTRTPAGEKDIPEEFDDAGRNLGENEATSL